MEKSSIYFIIITAVFFIFFIVVKLSASLKKLNKIKENKLKNNEDIPSQGQSFETEINQVQASYPVLSNYDEKQKLSFYTSKLHKTIESQKISIKGRLWDSDAEKKVDDILKSIISDEFIVIPHVGLREIFNWDWKDGSIPKSIAKMHFDFVIYNKDYQPVLVIEIWGKDHKDNPLVEIHDGFKEKLLKKLKLNPIVVIDLKEFIPDEQLKELVISKINDAELNVYCPACGAPMQIKTNKTTMEKFYGCTKYYDNGCTQTRKLGETPTLINMRSNRVIE